MKTDRTGQARVLSPAELDQLLAAAPSPAHRALWALQRWSAARISEALALQWGAIRGGAVTFKPSTTKTKTTRQVEIVTALAAEIDRYRQAWVERYGRAPRPDDFLFPSRPSMAEPMARQTADRILRATALAIGLEGVSTHSFRRSLATNSLRSGYSLPAIQRVTGHESLGSLGRYLEPGASEVRSLLEAA